MISKNDPSKKKVEKPESFRLVGFAARPQKSRNFKLRKKALFHSPSLSPLKNT
ncbi:uncharacterized protein METZ01_LOCUS241168, partial [marine metagenome]